MLFPHDPLLFSLHTSACPLKRKGNQMAVEGVSCAQRSDKLSLLSAGAVRVALKAFVEGIRLSVLSRDNLQQLQLDILSLRQTLPRQ